MDLDCIYISDKTFAVKIANVRHLAFFVFLNLTATAYCPPEQNPKRISGDTNMTCFKPDGTSKGISEDIRVRSKSLVIMNVNTMNFCD